MPAGLHLYFQAWSIKEVLQHISKRQLFLHISQVSTCFSASARKSFGLLIVKTVPY